jgi:transcriptional regulator of arginine metabolism
MPSKVELWSKRQAAIREILSTEVVRNQVELLAHLEKYGFRVTQSSVSRDLQEMRVIKVGGQYTLGESLLGANQPVPDELGEAAAAINNYRSAGPHLLVINTPPGRAAVVGLAIDRARWPEIVGTVAGDDTLFIATAGRYAQDKVNARLAALRKRINHV